MTVTRRNCVLKGMNEGRDVREREREREREKNNRNKEIIARRKWREGKRWTSRSCWKLRESKEEQRFGK